MRITLNASSLLITPDLDELRNHARQAHLDGFDGWWLAQTGLVDAMTVFALLGDSIGAMELGTAVVPTFTRHPTTLAGQALTAQAATSGRVTVGIGLSHKPAVEERLGMAFERPIRHLIDYLEILVPLLGTGVVEHDGEVFTTHAEGPRPTDRTPAVMVAALGEQSLRVAGRRTDGTILWLVGPKTIASHIVPHLTDAAESAGRGSPRVVCSLPVSVTDDEAEVRDLLSNLLAGYPDLPSYQAMLEREGVTTVGEVSVVGNEDSVREQLAAIGAAGATEFSAVEIGRNPDEQHRTRELLKEVRATR